MSKRLSLAIMVALAGCTVAPPGKPPAVGGPAGSVSAKQPAPTASSSGQPKGGGQAPASTARPNLLKPLAAAATRLTGKVELDARYATSVGGGSRLIGLDGAGLIGLDGATLIGVDGAGLMAGGRIVAAGAGNVVVPRDQLGVEGASLIGLDGAALIGLDGAALIGLDGAGLIGPDGAGYRLFADAPEPAPGESWAAAGMWISVVDTNTGFTVPLGLDEAGKEVHTIYTDARGRFEVTIPQGVVPRVVARAPGRRDPRMVLNVFAESGREVQVNDRTALATAFGRLLLGKRLLQAFSSDLAKYGDPGQVKKDGGGDQIDVLIDMLGNSGLKTVKDEFDRLGIANLPEERQLEIGLLLADRVLTEIDLESLKLVKGNHNYFDPASAALVDKPALEEGFEVFAQISERARQLAGADTAAYFNAKPYMIAANLGKKPEARYRIARPVDLSEFALREYLGSNDPFQYGKIFTVLDDLDRPLSDRDRLQMFAESFSDAFVLMLAKEPATNGKSAVDLLVEMLRGTGAKLAKAPAPPPRNAVQGGVDVPLPSPPAVEPYGPVETIAGKHDEGMHVDGPAATARLLSPIGLALDERGATPVLYVVDHGSHCIRRATFDAKGELAELTTIAGLPVKAGYADGDGATAQFSHPRNIALGPDGKLYVADSLNHAVRALSFGADGKVTVSTVLGGPASPAGLNMPMGLAFDAKGDMYVGDTLAHRVVKVALSEGASQPVRFLGFGLDEHYGAPIAAAAVSAPVHLLFRPDGGLYVLEALKGVIGFVKEPASPQARLELVAGGSSPAGPELDGYYSGAAFKQPQQLALDPRGRLVVADAQTHRIRLVTPDGWVRTLAGGGPSGATGGYRDGVGDQARFSHPSGVAVAKDGTIYVADRDNHVLRRLRPQAK